MGRCQASILAALLVYVLDAPAAAEQRGVTPPSAPAVLTLHEATRFLRIGSDELERLTRRKEVPAWRIGSHWRFEPVALLAAEAANAHAIQCARRAPIIVSKPCSNGSLGL